MSYDSGNKAQVKSARKRAKYLEGKMHNGFVKICNDPETRYVLGMFLDQAHVFADCFHPNPTDHAYNDGFRNAGLWWLNGALLHDPDIMGKLKRDDELEKKEEQYDGSNDTDD